MSACPACGVPNDPSDDFCGNCGTYLGWSDTPRREPAAPPPSPPSSPASTSPPCSPSAPGTGTPPTHGDAGPPPPASGPPGGATPGAGEGTTAGHPEPPPHTPATPPPGGGAADARAADDHAPDTSPPAAPATPAGEATSEGVPPTPTAPPRPPSTPPPPARPPQPPAPDPVGPVKPAKPVAPRPVVRHASVTQGITGPPCPSCGTANPPGRRFCRRCATRLTPAPQTTTPPWWRTLWRRRRRRARSGRLVRALTILAVVTMLAVAGVLLWPAGRELYEDTLDKLGTPEAITPVRTEATAELPGHPASHTTDGLTDHYWAAPAPGASVTYTFARPFRLYEIILTNGPSADAEEYARQARARTVELEIVADDGTTHRESVHLSDKPGPQHVPLGISQVRTIRLTLADPVGLSPGRHLALAEVEFFRRA